MREDFNTYDYGQLYMFGDNREMWSVRDFEESAQRFIDYFQRHHLPMNDASDPRVKGK